MELAAPNSLVTGFQWGEVRNPRPNSLIEGRESQKRRKKIATMSTTTTAAQDAVSTLKTTSPQLRCAVVVFEALVTVFLSPIA
jgi:hypothetical protein